MFGPVITTQRKVTFSEGSKRDRLKASVTIEGIKLGMWNECFVIGCGTRGGVSLALALHNKESVCVQLGKCSVGYFMCGIYTE